MTSVVDSAIGVTAAAHLAAALPAGPAHGLATLEWLAEDVATPPSIVAGKLQLAPGAGLGVIPTAGRVMSSTMTKRTFDAAVAKLPIETGTPKVVRGAGAVSRTLRQSPLTPIKGSSPRWRMMS